MDKQKGGLAPRAATARGSEDELLYPGEIESSLDVSGVLEEEDETESRVHVASLGDDLADELGASVVVSMTSGEDMLMDELDEPLAEEVGGPFLETTDDDELAVQAALEASAELGPGDDGDEEEPEPEPDEEEPEPNEEEPERDEDEEEPEPDEDEPQEEKKPK